MKKPHKLRPLDRQRKVAGSSIPSRKFLLHALHYWRKLAKDAEAASVLNHHAAAQLGNKLWKTQLQLEKKLRGKK